MKTKSGLDLFEVWAIVAACLEADAPMPEDVRAYLTDVARAIDELNEAVRLRRLEPKAAADAIPKRLGLTAGVYREWLHARRDAIAANAYEHQMAHRGDRARPASGLREIGWKSEDIAKNLAAQLGLKSGRDVYRARDRYRAKRARREKAP